MQSEPRQHSCSHVSLVCLPLRSLAVRLKKIPSLLRAFLVGCQSLVFISDWPWWASVPGSAPRSWLCDLGFRCRILDCGSEYAGKASEARQMREGQRGGRERVVISKGFGVVFCSEPVHWMMAGTAECLPMAQLFANLSPPVNLLPQLALGVLSHPQSSPFPSLLKNNSDLIWLSPSSLPRPIGETRDTAVQDLIKSHRVFSLPATGSEFTSKSGGRNTGGGGGDETCSVHTPSPLQTRVHCPQPPNEPCSLVMGENWHHVAM